MHASEADVFQVNLGNPAPPSVSASTSWGQFNQLFFDIGQLTKIA